MLWYIWILLNTSFSLTLIISPFVFLCYRGGCSIILFIFLSAVLYSSSVSLFSAVFLFIYFTVFLTLFSSLSLCLLVPVLSSVVHLSHCFCSLFPVCFHLKLKMLMDIAVAQTCGWPPVKIGSLSLNEK